jgi:hypothetical protein
MKRLSFIAVAILLALLFGFCFVAPYSTSAAIAATVLLVLPGTLLGLRLFASDHHSSRIFLAVGLGYLLAILSLYFCSQVFASNSTPAVIFFAALGSLAVILLPLPKLGAGSQTALIPLSRWLLPLILLLACFARLYQVGTPEFQGDEARALILAEALTHGQSDVLFLHKKGPAEVLIPYGILALTGQLSGFSARLPFALAGILIILGAFCLSRELWQEKQGQIIGLLAAGILSFDGFIFAFSRIVQYQSLLVLMCSCAVLCAIRARHDAAKPIYIYLAAAFAAAGLLSHYDTLLLLPLLSFICWPYIRGNPRHALLGLSLFAVICATFFLPFLLHDAIGTTASYLSQRLGPSQLPTNNLPRYLALLSFYTTTFETVVLVGLPLVSLCIVCWRRYKVLACLWAITLFGCIAFPELLSLGGKRSSAGLCVLILILFSFAKLKLQYQAQVIALWITPGLFALAFLFARPNTHFYVVHCGFALAAGLALHSLYSNLNRAGQRLLAASTLCFFGLNFYYTYIVYLRQIPEYRQVFPKARPLIFLASYADTPPNGAFFAFPRRSGWDVIQSLFQSGELNGSYDSNEEALITAWYTRGALRKVEWPDYYFISSNPNDPVPIPRTSLEKTYFFWGRIYVENQRRLDIYSRLSPGRDPKRFDYELTSLNTQIVAPLNLNNALQALNQSR